MRRRRRRAILWTVSYPLGARGAEQSATGVGVVMGLLNAVWAATAVVSPLFAGALVGPLGPRATFGVSQVAMLAVLGVTLAWMRSSRRADPLVSPRWTRPLARH